MSNALGFRRLFEGYKQLQCTYFTLKDKKVNLSNRKVQTLSRELISSVTRTSIHQKYRFLDESLYKWQCFRQASPPCSLTCFYNRSKGWAKESLYLSGNHDLFYSILIKLASYYKPTIRILWTWVVYAPNDYVSPLIQRFQHSGNTDTLLNKLLSDRQAAKWRQRMQPPSHSTAAIEDGVWQGM